MRSTRVRRGFEQIVMHPEDVAHFEAAVRDHFSGRTAHYDCEYRIQLPNAIGTGCGVAAAACAMQRAIQYASWAPPAM